MWRLTGFPRPTPGERLDRLVGARVARLPPGSGSVVVVAGSVARLRDLTSDPATLGPARRLLVLVARWRAPHRDWSGRIGVLDHLLRYRVRLPAGGRGTARVGLRVGAPAPLRDLIAAALPALAPTAPLPAPGSADVTAHGLLPAYLPAHPGNRVVAGDLAPNPEIRPHDLLLRPGGTGTPPPDPRQLPTTAARAAEPAEPRYAVAYTSTRHVAHAPTGPLILVDAERVNPVGRRGSCYQPGAPRVVLESGPAGGPRPVGESIVLRGPTLDVGTVARLRRVGRVRCPRLPERDAVGAATLLVQLAMTGVVLDVPALPPAVAELLDPALRALLAARPAPTDALGAEAQSVRQRRAALRGHATGLALPRAAGATFPALARPPSVSAVLLTRRSTALPAVLDAIAAQTYPELEIIVGLYGVAPPAQLPVHDRRIELVPLPAGLGLGAALGALTARAAGSLISTFADGDSYGPEHVWDLVLARHYSGATLVGKAAEFVHLPPLDTTVRRPGVAESETEVVAGGAMLISRGDLEAVGGWRPAPRSPERALFERVIRHGGRIYRTHPLGYVHRRRGQGQPGRGGDGYLLDTGAARWRGLPPHEEFGVDPAPQRQPI
ncbi:hypothetical protein [Micromonospora pattaloongensis]|uniref:hypothetical protein n=1 Tax=Micromonospora pattaloongensis TaxID=405436 RepID=UPI0011154685|nr:hypothetical protein [Micromonospora pattaloongensis]